MYIHPPGDWSLSGRLLDNLTELARMYILGSLIIKQIVSLLVRFLGSRHVQTRLVEPSVKSLNSGDVFVLVTPKELHLWNGKDASIMKKAKVKN